MREFDSLGGTLCSGCSIVVEIPDHGDLYHRIWEELIRLGSEAAPWTLIGSQMVHLHGWMAGETRPSLSIEADLLANSVRVVTATRLLSEQLMAAGYELTEKSAMGTGHRFQRDDVAIDVLAPELINLRDRRTYGTLATVSVPGGRQAIDRTISVAVRTRNVEGEVRVPNLLGAILIKARAVGVSSRPQSQREDFAFLLSLITSLDQAEGFRAELYGGQRRWLREHGEISDPSHTCWRHIANADRGIVAYRRLTS